MSTIALAGGPGGGRIDRRRRALRVAAWAAVPAALLGSAAIVGTASYSAFSASSANSGDSWSAGTVQLADDDAGTAMFSATNLKPGSTGSKCIAVTSTGSLPSAVKLYATGASTTNGLSSYIDIAITQGTGGSSASCTGFTPLASDAAVYTVTLAAFEAASTGYATGLAVWAPTGATQETRVYQIAYSVQAGTPNSAQGGTAAAGFTWEAQNS